MIEHFILLWKDLTTPSLTPIAGLICFFGGALIMWLHLKLKDDEVPPFK